MQKTFLCCLNRTEMTFRMCASKLDFPGLHLNFNQIHFVEVQLNLLPVYIVHICTKCVVWEDNMNFSFISRKLTQSQNKIYPKYSQNDKRPFQSSNIYASYVVVSGKEKHIALFNAGYIEFFWNCYSWQLQGENVNL